MKIFRNTSFFRYILSVFTPLYSLGVGIRNFLFDRQWLLTSRCYDVPLVGVGNLSVGGSGKTPHTEYLIDLLGSEYRVGVLSRGYGRKTRQPVLADARSTSSEIGDEPMQYMLKYARKYPGFHVYLDGNRVRGMQQFQARCPDTDVFLLDDAYQHRYVKPGLNILLTDYACPFYRDFLLPMGNLREGRRGKKRADIIVVTKTPEDISDSERSAILRKINPLPGQKVYFSSIHYGHPQRVGLSMPLPEPDSPDAEKRNILLFTGIANPRPLVDYISRQSWNLVGHFRFSDHHVYEPADLQPLREAFFREKVQWENLCILTTEKDYARLYGTEAGKIISDLPWAYIPIQIHFLKSAEEKSFDEEILDYINGYHKNTRI